MRRTQQQEVYKAQEAVSLGREFSSLEEVQQFVDELRETHWWPQDLLRVEVQTLRRDNKHAGVAQFDDVANCGIIGLRPDCMHLRVVAHELAHILADLEGSTSHDPIFCRKYLEVVNRLMGSDEYLKLYNSFVEHGIVFDSTDERTDA